MRTYPGGGGLGGGLNGGGGDGGSGGGGLGGGGLGGGGDGGSGGGGDGGLGGGGDGGSGGGLHRAQLSSTLTSPYTRRCTKLKLSTLTDQTRRQSTACLIWLH